MAFGQPSYYGIGQYPYQSQYNPYQYGSSINVPQQQNIQPIAQQQVQQQTQVQQPMLYGKIVDGVDVVRAMDVPFNEVAICPKADLSCVYIKSWRNDGTTRVNEYRIVDVSEITKDEKQYDFKTALDDIYASLDSLDKKIDELKDSKATTPKREKVVSAHE